MRRIVLVAAALAALGGTIAVSCGGRVALDGSTVDETPPPSPPAPPDFAPQRAYFGRAVRVTLDPTTERDVFLDLVAGARFRLDVHGDRGDPIPASLAWIRASGAREPLDAEPAARASSAEYDAPSDGRYAITLPRATPQASTAWIALSCTRALGRCTPLEQPGEICLAGHLCDEGLYCAKPNGDCAVWWDVGTCAERPPGNGCPANMQPVDAGRVAVK